jgi:hypothetical protein
MDTNNLIKSVISENIVESKKIATELLMQKLSERLQQKFEEYAPETFLDENTEETEETTDDANDLRLEVEEIMEGKKKAKKEEEESEEDEEESDEDEEDMEYEDGSDPRDTDGDLEYEGGKQADGDLEYEGGTDCEDGDCNDNKAEDMNKKAFRSNGLNEAKKANKDYDGDGKIESSTAEWRGSRSKAIKAAMAKRKNK